MRINAHIYMERGRKRFQIQIEFRKIDLSTQTSHSHTDAFTHYLKMQSKVHHFLLVMFDFDFMIHKI